MRKHLYLSLLLACGMPITAYANPEPQATQQSIGVITGTVVDENGDPVIGASVFEKGNARNGAATDINGQFSVKVKPGTMLKVSYIGYRPAEATAAQGMIITLTPADALLDEVVIVGYGAQKKVNLTGAVSTVDIAKTMEGRPQTDVAKALQGAVPGLTITTTSGDISENATMRIRGLGTLSNNAVSDPLIVVDGVPTDDISFLNTQDIESISVLKDAASSSIYGSRAAFGVILIQTKGAKEQDRVSVKYTNNFAWDKATYLPNYPDVPTQLKAAIQGKARQSNDAVELFGMYFNEMLPYAEAWQKQNDGKAGYREMREFQSWEDVGDYAIVDGTPLFYADWDVQDIFYQDAAPSQSHNLSVQGTSNATNYYMSLGYSDKEGLMKANPDE
ncbi:MAG: TonB-dependent receptor plug domain-containing protein, partial [Muribaculaceae bacterium]|nr:TonB-dependent receptor plug domain-containing protein [Muribaculaceae bacterium]